jgi:trigger factor
MLSSGQACRRKAAPAIRTGGRRLKAQVRDIEGLQKAIEIQLDVSEVNEFIDGMVGAYRRRYAQPGFRPGKAPDHVILARFQDDIERAIQTELVPSAIQDAFKEHDIHPAGPLQFPRIRYRSGEPLTFEVQVHVWPHVDLQPYEGIEIEQTIADVDSPQIDAFIDALADRAADRTQVDRPAQAGDWVAAELETIDETGARVKGTKKEQVDLEVGAENLLPDFGTATLGIGTGEAREFEVRYPEDYADKQLQGETRRYRLRATRIDEKKRPPIDDQFAKRFDANLDLDGLRARVRLRLESERRLAARERLEEAVVERLILDNPFELPEVSVRGALERLGERLREEGGTLDAQAIEQAYRPHIERFQRRDFLLDRVGDREGIHVSAEDVEAEIARLAREERRTPEEVRKDVGDPDRFRQFLFERRVFDALIGKVKVRELHVPAGALARE